MITSILIERHDDGEYRVSVVKESEDGSNQNQFHEGPFKTVHGALDAARGVSTFSPVVPNLTPAHRP